MRGSGWCAGALRRYLTTSTGYLPFDDITGVGLESDTRAVRMYRLTILCTHGPIPLTDSYEAGRAKYDELREKILLFVKGDAGNTQRRGAVSSPLSDGPGPFLA